MAFRTQRSRIHLAGGCKILVMDDNEKTRLGFRLVLHKVAKASELIEVDNPYSALRQAQEENSINLMLASARSFSGPAAMKLLWAIRRWQSPPPLYLITYPNENDQYIGRFLGAQGSILFNDKAPTIERRLGDILFSVH